MHQSRINHALITIFDYIIQRLDLIRFKPSFELVLIDVISSLRNNGPNKVIISHIWHAQHIQDQGVNPKHFRHIAQVQNAWLAIGINQQKYTHTHHNFPGMKTHINPIWLYCQIKSNRFDYISCSIWFDLALSINGSRYTLLEDSIKHMTPGAMVSCWPCDGNGGHW